MEQPQTGLWERSFPILTTQANLPVATLHDRMPVIIAEPDRGRWLTDSDPADLIRPYPANRLDARTAAFGPAAASARMSD